MSTYSCGAYNCQIFTWSDAELALKTGRRYFETAHSKFALKILSTHWETNSGEQTELHRIGKGSLCCLLFSPSSSCGAVPPICSFRLLLVLHPTPPSIIHPSAPVWINTTSALCSYPLKLGSPKFLKVKAQFLLNFVPNFKILVLTG